MAKIAIIETGGKQYVVTNDTALYIEKIPGTHAAGETISFDKVLLTDDGSSVTVGKPYINGAIVSAELLKEGRSPTIRAVRYREKSKTFKKYGHRQPYMKVRITALP